MEELDKLIWNTFVVFFKEVKGHTDWTEEEINMSYNEDDINEFLNYIRNTF